MYYIERKRKPATPVVLESHHVVALDGNGEEFLLKSSDCFPPALPESLEESVASPRQHHSRSLSTVLEAEVASAGGLFFLSLHMGVCFSYLWKVSLLE